MRAERGLCDVVAEAGPVRAAVLPPPGAEDRLTPCTGDRVAPRPATAAVSATDARLRAELERPKKQGARLRRAIEQSPNFTA